MAGVVFGVVSDRTKFYISAWCGLMGALVTLLMVPDISGLDLSEGRTPFLIVSKRSLLIKGDKLRARGRAGHAAAGAR